MSISRDKGGKWEASKHSDGPPTWERVLFPISNLAAMKRGGKIRKTGVRELHKGERVIPAGKVKRVEKMMKRSKMRMRARS
jgi:hypothetical protein